MDSNRILQELKQDLIKEGLDCEILSFDDLMYGQLSIYTGKDREGRTLLLEIKVPDDKLSQALATNSVNDCVNIQLLAFFPFVVEDLALIEVAQFLHYLNFQVDVPGFYLDFLDKKIVYKYVLLSEKGHVPKKILLSLIGISMFFQDVFGQTLERLSKGEVTFLDLMQEIKDILVKAGNSN